MDPWPLAAVPKRNQNPPTEDASSSKRSYTLAIQKQNPPTDEPSYGSHQSGDGRQPVVLQSQKTPTNEVSSSHQSGDGRQPVVLQNKDTPIEDVSAGSPQALGLESMTGVGTSLPAKQHPGGIRALVVEKKRLSEEWKARQKANTPMVAKRPAPASEDQPNKRLQAGRVIGLGELPDAEVEPHPFGLSTREKAPDPNRHPFGQVTRWPSWSERVVL